MKSWGIRLGDTFLSGSCDNEDLPKCDDGSNAVSDPIGTLSSPPEGLGVPQQRNEDVTYPQRDGIGMFSDWYENRVITLSGVTVGEGDCQDCPTTRERVSQITAEWSRRCDETELVVFTDCHGEISNNQDILETVNLVNDPSFEVDTSWWNVEGGIKSRVPGGPVGIKGEWAAEIEPTSAETVVESSAIEVDPGVIYSFSFYVYQNVTEPLDVQYDFYDSGDNFVTSRYAARQSIPQGQWFRWRNSITVPVAQDIAYVRTRIIVENQNYPCDIADIAGEAPSEDTSESAIRPRGSNVSVVFIGTTPTGTGTAYYGIRNYAVIVTVALGRNSVGGNITTGGMALNAPTGQTALFSNNLNADTLELGGAGDNVWPTAWRAIIFDSVITPEQAQDIADCVTSGNEDSSGTPWMLDAVQFERNQVASNYFDGDLDDTETIEYSWLGTRGDSPSLREMLDQSPNREIVGPFGVKGRPRVADVQWRQIGDASFAELTLRFDSIDHRLYVLDDCGTPGSGEASYRVITQKAGDNYYGVIEDSAPYDWWKLNEASDETIGVNSGSNSSNFLYVDSGGLGRVYRPGSPPITPFMETSATAHSGRIVAGIPGNASWALWFRKTGVNDWLYQRGSTSLNYQPWFVGDFQSGIVSPWTVTFRSFRAGSSAPTYELDQSAWLTLFDGEPHFVAGTRQGNTARLYLDGELAQTFTLESADVNANWGVAAFQHTISNLTRYQRVLSEEEIEDYYIAGITGLETHIHIPGQNCEPVRINMVGPLHNPTLYSSSGDAIGLLGRIPSGDRVTFDTSRGTATSMRGVNLLYRVTGNPFFTVDKGDSSVFLVDEWGATGTGYADIFYRYSVISA